MGETKPPPSGLNEYDEQSQFWQRKEPQIQSDFLVRPKLVELCGDCQGKTILDAGCGEGYLTRLLDAKGAQVTGLDISEEMVNQANEADRAEGITEPRFLAGDVLKLPEYIDHQVDIVVSSMVFPYFDRDKIDQAINGMIEVLNPGGIMIIATTHPMMGAVEFKSGWAQLGVTEDGDYFANGQYPATLASIRGESFSTKIVHASFSDLINPILENGCILEQIIEPQPTEEDLAETPEMWVEEKTKPAYIIIKARKPELETD